jgi:hypothetical protein
MKTGWVLSITDLQAKDKAFKHYSKSRSEVALKATELLERYESVYGKDRFRIEISSPHTEIEIENRMKVSHHLEGYTLPELFGKLHDLNPFMYKTEGNIVFFEVDLQEQLPDGFTRI